MIRFWVLVPPAPSLVPLIQYDDPSSIILGREWKVMLNPEAKSNAGALSSAMTPPSP